MKKFMDKKAKKMDGFDLGLIKWSVVAFVFFLMGVWPGLANWVLSVNPWYFLIAFVILVARPFYRFYLK